MVVGCVQHYSTYFIIKLGKSLELFYPKVQKTAKKGKKGQKRANKWAKMQILAYLLPYFHFGSIFVHFEQQQKI